MLKHHDTLHDRFIKNLGRVNHAYIYNWLMLTLGTLGYGTTPMPVSSKELAVSWLRLHAGILC